MAELRRADLLRQRRKGLVFIFKGEPLSELLHKAVGDIALNLELLGICDRRLAVRELGT